MCTMNSVPILVANAMNAQKIEITNVCRLLTETDERDDNFAQRAEAMAQLHANYFHSSVFRPENRPSSLCMICLQGHCKPQAWFDKFDRSIMP